MIVAVGTTIATRGQWVFYPWSWITVVVGAALIGWNARGTCFAAGADWLQSRRHRVRLYELTSIKHTTKPGSVSVLLEDGHGGSAGATCENSERTRHSGTSSTTASSTPSPAAPSRPTSPHAATSPWPQNSATR